MLNPNLEGFIPDEKRQTQINLNVGNNIEES